jgi:hypothetical protein
MRNEVRRAKAEKSHAEVAEERRGKQNFSKISAFLCDLCARVFLYFRALPVSP